MRHEYEGEIMADIIQDFPIKASPVRVYRGVSSTEGLDCWWTKTSAGQPVEGSLYELGFGPRYDWRAEVSRHVPDAEFELRMVDADSDWLGTRVGFQLESKKDKTWVRFHHLGWPTANEHYRISCYCWSMYLRLLRRYLEYGECVPFESRLDV